MMGDNQRKAEELIAEAAKKLKPGFLENVFGSTQARTEEAAELYVRAANTYKMGKKWTDAGKSFVEAALLRLKVSSKHEAGGHYVDAATCFKKDDPQEAINCLTKAVEIYTDMGRFTIAARHHMSMAEVYEGMDNGLEKAIQNYEQAADYYKGEESKSSANKCLLKVAQYCAQLEKYDRAIEVYEQVGMEAVESPLLKYSAKEYFFRAALCHLCVDFLNAQHALARYGECYPAWTDSRECKLLAKLIQAIEEENPDDFTESVKEYDSVSRLDQWYTTILLRIKKTLAGDGDLK